MVGRNGGVKRKGKTCLEETEDIVCLSCVLRRGGCLANGGGQGCPLAESTVLHGSGKEGGRVDLFPEVKGGLVPAAGDIVEVELDDGPESVCGVGGVAVCNEPVGVGDDGGRPESRAVTLGTAPGAGEGGFVDVKLGLAEAAGRDGAAGVGDLLYGCLCLDEHVDEGREGGVLAEGVLVDEGLEDEGGIADPGVEVVWVGGARAGDDDAGLVPFSRRRCGERGLTYAPEDREPDGPMLARMPAFATGDSAAT